MSHITEPRSLPGFTSSPFNHYFLKCSFLQEHRKKEGRKEEKERRKESILRRSKVSMMMWFKVYDYVTLTDDIRLQAKADASGRNPSLPFLTAVTSHHLGSPVKGGATEYAC